MKIEVASAWILSVLEREWSEWGRAGKRRKDGLKRYSGVDELEIAL
jgi:hypothetical protein